MIHTPRARRFALAALIAGALVASPALDARSWAGESPTPGASVKHANGDKDKDKGKAKHKNRNKNKNDDKDHGKDKGKAKNKTDGKGKNNAKAGKTKAAPVVVDDSNTEFKAGKPKAKDQAKPKAAAKKAKAAPKKTETKQAVNCYNPLIASGDYAWRGKLTTGNPATWTFTVKAGCSFTGGLDSWKLPVPRFVTDQTHVDRKAGTYGPGEHTLTVTRAKCWQLDGYTGTQPAGSIWYEGRLLVTHIGGTEPCATQPPVDEEPVPPVDEKEEPVKETPVTPTKRPAKKVEKVERPAKRIVVKKAKPAPAPVQPKHPELAGALPFTGGPRDLLLPAGLGMFALGLALVLATRRREAQLDIASRAVARALRKPYRGPRETL